MEPNKIMEPVYFSGNVLDRCSEVRNNKQWLEQAYKKHDTKVIIFKGCDPLVQQISDNLELCIFLLGDVQWIFDQPDNEMLFLGKDRETCEVWFAVNFSSDVSLDNLLNDGKRKFASQRFDLVNLVSEHGSIVSQAKSMFHWHNRYQFCPSCGSKTKSDEGGYKRTCLNSSCRSNQGVHNTCYPRTDPTVIMCVVSSDRLKCLLGRKANFPSNMYSCLAGFMEPGESIEDAVIRETKEESGIDVKEMRYIASQPWPYPSSLMIGCVAKAASEDIIVCEEEMEDVRWFQKEEVELALVGQSKVLRLPPHQAIAHQLIKYWVENGYTSQSVSL